VAGGANFPDKMPWEGGRKVWYDTVWILDRPDGVWREAGKLPRPLAYGVSVSVTGRVLCIGGSDAERHYADVLGMIQDGGTLQIKSEAVPGPLPIPLAYAAGAVDEKENIYVACGSMEPGEKRASNRVFLAGGVAKASQWRELPPLPAEPRILPTAAAHGEFFYVFGGAALEEKGGKTVRRYLRDAWRYSAGQGWQRLADMPRACAAAAAPAPSVQTARGHRVYVIAGDDGTKAGSDPAHHPGFPAGILCYDTVANTWSATGETPAPRATVPCVKWGQSFVLPGGEVRPGVRSPEVWSFTPDLKSK